jgi:capsular exopolysaccharide synthesis family protein
LNVDRSLILHPSRQHSDPVVRLERWMLTDGEEAEQFRVLCTRIRSLTGERERHGGKVIGITSASAGEGKTLSAVNFAGALARDFLKQVLLVEGDLRRPTLSRRQASLPGLVQGAKGELPFDQVIFDSDVPNLSVMVAGHAEGASSTHFLGAPLLRQALIRLRERYEYIIVDCAPLVPAADMGLVVEWVDHLLLVIRAGVTDRSLVARALDMGFRERVLGVILNGVSSFGDGYSGSSY